MIGNPGEPLPAYMCGPGTECVEGICKKMKIPDPDFFPGYECDQGICHCAVIENNSIIKIYGEFQESENTLNEKQCGNIQFIDFPFLIFFIYIFTFFFCLLPRDLECSHFTYKAKKVMSRLLSNPDISLPTVRCLPSGQYDPLQCINDMCGCVNQETGAWDFKIINPKIHMVGQYFKICEKEKNEIMNEKFGELFNNYQIIQTHKVECYPNGEYVPQKKKINSSSSSSASTQVNY
ncbi:hypothetical protein Phum_PHUM524800 [Pediculus humanus corporis]|uniref:Thyroglobulin type-1 domain-containing protein n=1 Tax=Pediculus humanus subsp. corporis TaxID=121224 RepID=E0VZ47_PEDHC|nr:uncharacterized protein Phum_PHUM524800 [Pediculus humanus corporis]EEB18653.1 hypothetical protein Phum_PHUM524800 [Pediculus humanus corporis]